MSRSDIFRKLELSILFFGLIVSSFVLFRQFTFIPDESYLFFEKNDKITLVIDSFWLNVSDIETFENLTFYPGILLNSFNEEFSNSSFLYPGDHLSNRIFTFLIHNASSKFAHAEIVESGKNLTIRAPGFGTLHAALPYLFVGILITNTSSSVSGCICYQFTAFPVTTTRWSFDHEPSYFYLVGLNTYKSKDLSQFPYATTYYKLYHGSSRIESVKAFAENSFFNSSKSSTLIDQSINPLDIDNLLFSLNMSIQLRWIYD